MQPPENTVFLTISEVEVSATERATVGMRFLLDVAGLRPGSAPALELTPDEADALAHLLQAKAALARSSGPSLALPPPDDPTLPN